MTSNLVQDLFKRFWQWRMSEFPEFATFVGNHSYDDKLQSYSLDSIEKRKEIVGQFLDEASQLLSDQKLENEDKVNLTYFTNDLKVFLNGMNAESYYFPICFLDGVHIEIERLLAAMKNETEADYLRILERLSQLPSQVSQIIEIMREGIKKKMTFHLISVSGVLRQLDLLQLKPEETVFYKPFAAIPETVSFTTITKEELILQAKKIIEHKVLPAFLNLKNFLEKEYFQHVRSEISISSLGKGNEIYQMCLNYHLSCTMTPKEIHETGLKEVERIKSEIERIMKRLETSMPVNEFSNYLKEEKNFCYETVDELLENYRKIIFNDIEPKLPQIFNYLPKCKPVIKTTPSSSPNAPAAYYYAGTLEESKPGIFYVNVTNLKSTPKYEAVTLALHEAMPGHHLQGYYLIESENIPDFRRYLEDRRYTEAPSLFPLYTAYIEGWGLYSEYLGYDLGLYSDPYMEFGHLSYEMFRACRLVVDTGIHAFGWSRDKAVDYILQHTGMSKREVENEVDRYITWPGQACGYKIGEIKIKALRELAEKSLGSKFDIRDFHDVILRSFGPLHLLEERVKDYIKNCSS